VHVVQDIWPHLTNLKWIHSASAGVEKLLFPELVKSSVTVTNAKVSITVPAGDVLSSIVNAVTRDALLVHQRPGAVDGIWDAVRNNTLQSHAAAT